MYRKKFPEKKKGRTGHWKASMVKQTYRLALLGATDQQIADFFEIPVSVIAYWKQHNEAFNKALRKGKIEADSKVAKALYRRALGYSHPDSVVLTKRVITRDLSGKILTEDTVPMIVPIIKYYPPDSYACQKWLSARQREAWADVSKLQITHNGSVDLYHLAGQLSDVDNFSMEDLQTMLRIGIKKAKENSIVHQN